MRKIILLIAFMSVALFSMAAISPEDAQIMDQMNSIRSNPAYKFGESNGEKAFETARQKAREDLFSKLRTTLVSQSTLKDDEFSSQTTAITVGAIENLKELYVADGDKYIFMAYVAEEDLKEAEQDRKDFISDIIQIGQQQESLLNISQALKYYTWAYRMLSVFQDKGLRVDTPNGERNAMTWLSNHIPAMLRNISLNIPEEKIEEDSSMPDKYIVTVEATYNGMPVQSLDISYNNGETLVPAHFKSGEGVFTFYNLAPQSTLNVRTIFDYPEEGRNTNPALAAVYGKGYDQLKNFKEAASMQLPLKLNKDKIRKSESKPEFTGHVINESDIQAVADAQPVVKAPKKPMERPVEVDLAKCEMMMRVEQSIRSKDYNSVKSDFTPEGFSIFEQMMRSGDISVIKKDLTYTVERSGIFIIGKSIPVAVRNNKHVSRENLVFRFDPESGKIRSVAYALNQRAEDDIFRETAKDWTTDSRYALVQFMEDYQTAFALKRFDYINSIFSDDAIIIVGKELSKKSQKRSYQHDDIKGTSLDKSAKHYRYTTYNKEAYLSRVKEDFNKKSFIRLMFEDTKVEKVVTQGSLNNNYEVLWIELRQKYESSNYSDDGYLALQINLRPEGSQIHVRTWTPYFIPIPSLKKAFPIGI